MSGKRGVYTTIYKRFITWASDLNVKPFSASFSLISSLTVNIQYKFLSMTDVEPRTSGIGSNSSTNWATTTAPSSSSIKNIIISTPGACSICLQGFFIKAKFDHKFPDKFGTFCKLVHPLRRKSFTKYAGVVSCSVHPIFELLTVKWRFCVGLGHSTI